MRSVIPRALTLLTPVALVCLWFAGSWAGPPASSSSVRATVSRTSPVDAMIDVADALPLPDAMSRPRPPHPLDVGWIGDVMPKPTERSDSFLFDVVQRPPEVRPIPPDPVPLMTRAIYLLGVRFERGEVKLERVRHEVRAHATALPRTFGRFAAELYVGPTLLDRTRFDFPLIHDDSRASDTYERGLSVMVDIRIPDSDRPNRLEIWDRATDRRWTYRYPLTLTPVP